MAGDGALVGKRLGRRRTPKAAGNARGLLESTTCGRHIGVPDEPESLVVAPIVLGGFGRKIVRAAANTLKGF
jgi:hypothetical protein